MRDWKPVLGATGWAVLAGVFLRLSLPPFGLPICVPMGLAVALVVADDDACGLRGWVGFCCGIVWHSYIPIGVLSWGLSLSVLTLLVPSLVVSSAFALSSLVGRLVGRGSAASVLVFPIAWMLVSSLGDFVGAPVSLSVGWIERPSWLTSVRWLGTIGTDGLIATVAAGAAHAARVILSGRTPGLLCGGLAGIGPVLILWVGSWIDPPASFGSLQVHAIDAAIPVDVFKQAKLSLFERHRIERRIDRLTKLAVERKPGVILLPEGGNGLFNSRIRRRREASVAALGGTTSELLLSSPDLTPDRSLYNAVHHVTRSGFGRTARKANTVLLAEDSLGEGEPTTLDTRWGRVGIAICYDSIFGTHIRALANAGAQVIFAVSDDASFGASFLADIHLAYSRLRALEVGRGLVFLSNLGPVANVSSDGTMLERPPARHAAAIHSFDVSLVAGGSAATEANWVIPVLLLILLIYRAGSLVERRHCSYSYWSAVRRPRMPVLAIMGAGALTLTTAVFFEVGTLSYYSFSSLSDAVVSIEQRLRPEHVMSSLPALFKQRGEVDCGPEALAFAMTWMGDEVFGAELVRGTPPHDVRGYSLLSLAQLARDRGFAAEGYTGDLRALSGPGRPPIIAHLATNHFVTVLGRDAGYVTFFDPGTGYIHKVDEAKFAVVWSGRYLSLGTIEM